MQNIENSLLIEPAFQLLNINHCKSILQYLQSNNRPFQITCLKQFTEFKSEDMSFLDSLNDIFLLSIENYSLESLVCLDNHIEFTVGFGDSNEGVLLKVPYGFIVSLEEFYSFNLYRNPSILISGKEEVELEGVETSALVELTDENLHKSKSNFLNNPKNNKFAK